MIAIPAAGHWSSLRFQLELLLHGNLTCEMVWAGDGGSDGGDPLFPFVAMARAVVS